MKSGAFLLFVVLSLCGINHIDGHSLILCSDADKVYVSADQVLVSSEGIFVSLGAETVAVSILMQDNQGIYYLTPSIYWRCKSCGYAKNPAWTNYCEECGLHYAHEEPEEPEP